VSVLVVEFDAEESRFAIDERSWTIPIGVLSLAAMLQADPPLPEELTNAIGLIVDHLDDVTRELPAAAFADTLEICGLGIDALAAVELGATPTLPFLLGRDAAEEVFRTLATEAAADRSRNPGLQAELVHTVLGACCAVVGVMRSLHVPSVTVVAA